MYQLNVEKKEKEKERKIKRKKKTIQILLEITAPSPLLQNTHQLVTHGGFSQKPHYFLRKRRRRVRMRKRGLGERVGQGVEAMDCWLDGESGGEGVEDGD
jgi:hypothetical protein